ncbi:MAG: ATP phosphoribosyltransferase regulatory subunit [Gammaproteobacteria bacterium]|nr:ATP phosphoribosyltransferase regulatory subunit [Gammaproteobacteria bacterium]
MSAPSVHDDWLSLIEISGPFLAVPVLKEAFPQGLEELDATKRKRLRQAYEEWREALELEDAQFAELHTAWIDEVLSRGLELDEDGKGDVLKRADWCAANLQASLPEHGVTLSPDLAVVDEQRANKPLLLIQTYAQDVDLDATLKQDGWAATPADRMVQLCRSLGCRLGLVTNGERWMLVDAPIGAVTTFASWYARIWSQEPITLQAFVHLLGIRRFFVDESEQLPALFDRSLKFQDEVTDALGEQVRRAVEVLIQTLDKADQDRNRELLHDVKEPELYEAALTVMMRLVFLLSAEERGLLLMGDERYEANYALSTLRMQLRKESEEILERRWDAWSRLLAIFRAVFGGIEHENLRLPALGGSLFDPDRFPFLEGRAKGSNWRTDAATPLPIDNRTVLLLLEAIQQFQGRTLSYRALDVEQIGYVYEGLLERTVKRTDEVTLELDATKSAKTPWIKLAELDSASLDGASKVEALLRERTGSSASRVRKDLAKPVDDILADRLLTACQGETKLRDRIKPYAHLLRTDPWGYPLVYPAGAFIVTTGSDRRETGTHYTPKSLTEAIVAETLTPVAYVGPAEGTPRDQWVLKSPAELLDLKICDPAMGSGAFLVQACRWLSDRLVEAWSQVEALGKAVSVDGEVLDAGVAKEPLPRDSEARTVIARRLIAERCLYGVDLNPLAVELAKLSIWLVTLAKGRPFGFLDHNLRCGDSLLGIHRLEQLVELAMSPSGKRQQNLFGQNIERAVREAIELRQQLREMPIRDIRDVETMAHLDTDARRTLEVPESIANTFIGEVFASGGNGTAFEGAMVSLSVQAGQAIDGDRDVLASIRRRSISALSTDLPADKSARRPFHWPLEFPEVFARERSGFDCIVGNPPFSGGRWIGRRFGQSYQEYLKLIRNGVVGSPDLCVYFFLRAFSLLGSNGGFGLLATKSITETGSRVVCLDQITEMGGTVYRGCSRMVWPGNAAVVVSIAWVTRNGWQGQKFLDDKVVPAINGALEEDFQIKRPVKLKTLKGKFSQGQDVMGRGFELTAEERAAMLAVDPKCSEVIFPLFNGQDLNNMPVLKPYRWVIYFRDWPEETARQYDAAFRRVEELVKPYRESLTGQIHQDCFWKFWDLRPNLLREAASSENFLASPVVTKYVTFRKVPTSNVFNHKTKLYFLYQWADFAVLQSSLHQEWAFWSCGTLGASTLSYSTTAALETWPMPDHIQGNELEELGNRYHSLRENLMTDEAIGLTQLYNRFHDQSDDDSRIAEMRVLHRKIDLAVARAYGWGDLDLEHGFHDVPYLPENDRARFTISGRVRLEVLRRLSELNHKRYEEEVAQGLHGGNNGARAPRRATRTASSQPSFNFESNPVATNPGVMAATAIFDFLCSHRDWHAKADILAATGVTDGQWNTAIAELITGGKVERQGERRGARYRATDAGGAAQ